MQNVLLITIDCLRADCLRPAIAPNLVQFRERSWHFEQTFATGIRTAESFPGILTSTFPLSFGGAWKLPEELVSLAQVLQQAGYATAAFHSNPFLSRNMGYDRGFATFWDSQERTPVTSRLGARVMPLLNTGSGFYRLMRKLVRYFEAETGMAHYVRAEAVNRRADEWLDVQRSPFFLWLHYMDLHYPYAPPERFIRQLSPEGVGKRQQADLLIRSLERPATMSAAEAQILRDLYDAALLYVDDSIARLLERLQARGQADDTVIVLTGDHGEEFLEHGEFGHGGNVHVKDDGAARVRLYDELLHVPLLLHLPDRPDQPGRTDALASLADLPPTVADLLHLDSPESWQGKSLLPLIEGRTEMVHEGSFSEYAVREEALRYPVVAYRTKAWKYIHDGASGNHELYDLETDPAEQHNLYSPSHPEVPAMAAVVREHLRLAEASPHSVVEAAMDAAFIERLRNLGYVE